MNPANVASQPKNLPGLTRKPQTSVPVKGRMESLNDAQQRLVKAAEGRQNTQSWGDTAKNAAIQKAERALLTSFTGGASEIALKAYRHKKAIGIFAIVSTSIIALFFIYIASAAVTLWENKTELAKVVAESAQNGSCRELAAEGATFGVINVAEDNDFNKCVNYIFAETDFLRNGSRLNPAD